VKDLFPKFWFHTTKLVESLTEVIDNDGGKPSDGAPVDVDRWLMRATLDIIAAAGFGVNVNAIKAPENDLAKTLPLINATNPQANFFRLLAFFVPQWLYFRLPMARRYEVDRIKKVMADATIPIISSRRAALSEKDTIDPDSEGELSGSNAQIFADTDIISTLLRFPQSFTDEELLDQSATILAAGQDTTSIALTWALYLLAHHPEIQAALRIEIQNHLPSPSSDESVNAQLIESLPCLAAVCSEVLRLYPPATLIRRRVVKPGTFILGHHMPVGTMLITSVWGTHRLQSVWGPDVKEFKPERFIQYGEDGKMKFDAYGGLKGELAMYTFMPFGAGVRSCIGERFARGEFATLLAGLVGRFEWSPTIPNAKIGEDITINFGIIIKPQGGLSLRAKRLEGW